MTMNTTAQRLRHRLARLAAALLAVTVLGAIIPPTPASADFGVGFNDAQLEAKIRTALSVPSGSITTSMMAGLTSLDISNAGVTDLSGLEYATNLQYLVALNNQISDLSPLIGLSSLQELTLQKNNITDVSDLSGLTNLTKLTIGDNPISSLTPLAGLTKLRVLSLPQTAVTDITPVAGFTSMFYLDISNTDVADLSPLKNLTAPAVLYAFSTKVTDLTPLAGLVNLDLLDVTGDPITSLEPLANLVNLRELDAYSTDTITDLTPLAGLPKLQHLGVSGGQIYDISPLAQLNAGPGWVYLGYNWLDLSLGSSTQQTIDTLVDHGYDVYVSPQREGGTVTGVVTDGHGTPLAGATVTADTGQHTTTAANGTYSLVQLKPGVRTLTFTKASYTTTTQSPSIDATVPATADAIMAATPGTISGTVSATSGAPVSGATVTLDGSPATTTAADGSYTLPASAGNHTLTVTKAYYLDATTSPTVTAGSGVTANVTLTPVQLGQTITRSPSRATITAKRKHGKAILTLSATFTDARGAITGQTVQLQRSTNGKTKWKNVYLRVTDAAGRATVVVTTKKRQTVYYRWYAPTTTADLTKTSAKQKVRVR